MDIQQVAAQLISYLGSDPDKIAQFAQHPYSTTAKVAGTDETISQKDMSRVVAQVAAQSSGQELGTDATKSLASALLGESGGSVHALTSALFWRRWQRGGRGCDDVYRLCRPLHGRDHGQVGGGWPRCARPCGPAHQRPGHQQKRCG